VQVRYAACAATRAFMEAAAGWREETFPALLPPMCLNRRYQAEGVRLYSQRTWELVMGSDGRAWVARLAPQVRICNIATDQQLWTVTLEHPFTTQLIGTQHRGPPIGKIALDYNCTMLLWQMRWDAAHKVFGHDLRPEQPLHAGKYCTSS